MESISISLFLLLAVVVSGSLARLSPVPLPLPIVQIALGAVIAVTTRAAVALQPDIFFLLFLPPLLFLDGWRIPKQDLFRDKETVLELALGLVVFTVVGVGFFTDWLIPQMPLPVAFALAAILSPTDPIAVSAIAARVPIPKRLMHILEGESLLNDASGLVCMRFAVAAALTGTFSLVDATLTFVWLAVGGIAIGVGVTWGVMRAKKFITRRIGEESGSQVLISLLIPFGAYLLAEEAHCSGILAAVAAGITMSFAEYRGEGVALTRVHRGAVWDTVQFTANGVIFVLLGEQFPSIAASAFRIARDLGHPNPLWLIVYVLATSAALIVLRFVWVWVSLRFTLFRAVRKGQAPRRPSWRLIVATSLAGARGAITLAGVLTLPLTLNNGTPFPARDLAIFIAAGVIVVSLIVASIGLPFVLKGLDAMPEASHRPEEDAARIAGAQAAIKAIQGLARRKGAEPVENDMRTEAVLRFKALYRARIDGHEAAADDAERGRLIETIENEIRLAAVKAEREEYYRLNRARQIPEETWRKLVQECDLLEARITSA